MGKGEGKIEKGREKMEKKRKEYGERRRGNIYIIWFCMVGFIHMYMCMYTVGVYIGMVSQSSTKHYSQRRGRPAPN